MPNLNKIKLPDNTVLDINDARIPGIDSTPTQSSTNMVTSGGVYSALQSVAVDQMVSITWSDLKDLRDGGNLVPGMQYRITDYVTATAQDDTRSAGHPFDIIVTADSEDTLNENARAAKSIRGSSVTYRGTTYPYMWSKYVTFADGVRQMIDSFYTDADDQLWCYENQDSGEYLAGFYAVYTDEYTESGGEIVTEYYYFQDTIDDPVTPTNYFDSANLSAWELKYCLDNDTTRFAWADTTSGKGVIYRMIDEWNNECPYDFKNIQFKRYKITACPSCPYLVDQYSCSGISGITVDISNPYWVYTFSMINLFEDVIDDVSVLQDKYPSDEGFCYRQSNNIIKESFVGNDEDGTSLQALQDNVFVTDTDLAYVEDDYSYGEFYGYNYNTLGNDCTSNTFGDACYANTFGNYCTYNTFGDACYANTLGNNCTSNTFGDACNANTFGNNCTSNTFGDACNANTFGNYCTYNTFGDACYANTLGNNCTSNTFGDACNANTFGNNCYSIKTGNSGTLRGYYGNIIVDNGNHHIYLYCSNTTSSSYKYQNVHIGLGVNNTNTYKTITDANRNQTFQTEYLPKNSQTISV